MTRTETWNEALEVAANVVDQCNREGPYNAIGAASRIRELKKARATFPFPAKEQPPQ